MFLLCLICLTHLLTDRQSFGLSFEGKNVCSHNESFVTTVSIQEPYHYQVRDTKWCFSVPPRCTIYRTIWSTRWVKKNVTDWKEVARCCVGYVAGPHDDDCTAHCRPPCKQGLCHLPDKCSCEPGYRGHRCEETCLQGYWGDMCRNQCDCVHSSFCYSTTGECRCSAGWIGRRCDEPCSVGFHGQDCKQLCNCGDFDCHHITGECIVPSTTEPPTTPLLTSTPYELSTSTEVSTASSDVTYSTSTELSTTIFPSTSDASSTISTSESPTSLSTISTTQLDASESSVLEISSTWATETDLDAGFNETLGENGQYETKYELARFAATVVLSVLGAIALLIAAAGFAFARHRKAPLQVDMSDIGLHKFYGEATLPVKTLFNNPTYGCSEMDSQKTTLQTFKPVADSFEAEIREMLQAQYDHPPRLHRLSMSTEHLYDEIAANFDEHKLTTFFKTSRPTLSH